MQKYVIPEKSFINNATIEAGEIIEYDGIPGSEWKLVEDKEETPKSESPKKGSGSRK